MATLSHCSIAYIERDIHQPSTPRHDAQRGDEVHDAYAVLVALDFHERAFRNGTFAYKACAETNVVF